MDWAINGSYTYIYNDNNYIAMYTFGHRFTHTECPQTDKDLEKKMLWKSQGGLITLTSPEIGCYAHAGLPSWENVAKWHPYIMYTQFYTYSLAWPDPLGSGAYRLEIISASRRGAYNLQSISACAKRVWPRETNTYTPIITIFSESYTIYIKVCHCNWLSLSYRG